MKICVIIFLSFFLLISSDNCYAQYKFDFTHHSFKLLTFDISKSRYPLGGTGFIIKKGDNYYLVSALHLFANDTVYKDVWRMIPSAYLSKKDLVIQKYNKSWSMIHNEELLLSAASESFLKYHWILFDSTRAFDIGVLKLVSPAKEITDFAIPFDQLDLDTNITNANGMVSGFPGRSDSSLIFETHLNNPVSEMEKGYFFDISCPPNLEGMSGSPVYTGIESDKPKIKGIFVGQSSSRNSFYGTVVYAKFIRDIILQME